MLHAAISLIAFNAPKKPVQILQPTNATALKAVFFSGDPWLIQCGSKTDLAAGGMDAGLGAHEVVELSLPKLPIDAQVGLLDCAQKLPSGKSTLDRFKLNVALQPTLVFSANGQAPFQVTQAMLAKHGTYSNQLFPTPRQQAASLAAFVKTKSEKKAHALTKSEHMHAFCLKRKYCVVVLVDGIPSGEQDRVLHKLFQQYRSVAFATINTARYEFSLSRHRAPRAQTHQRTHTLFCTEYFCARSRPTHLSDMEVCFL